MFGFQGVLSLIVTDDSSSNLFRPQRQVEEVLVVVESPEKFLKDGSINFRAFY